MALITTCQVFTKGRARPLNVCMECDWSIEGGLQVLGCKTADGKAVRPKLSVAEFEVLHGRAWARAYGLDEEEEGFHVEWVACQPEDSLLFVENLELF